MIDLSEKSTGPFGAAFMKEAIEEVSGILKDLEKESRAEWYHQIKKNNRRNKRMRRNQR